MPQIAPTERVPTERVPTGRGGRPRDPSRDVAIRGAILRVLADVGYGALTMDAVASRAGVGKATIYRRWRTKEALVADTISDLTRHLSAPADTGSVEGDVRLVMHALVADINGPIGSAIRSLLPEAGHQLPLRRAVLDGPREAWGEIFATVWTRAERRGELPAGMAGSIAAEAIGALLTQRWLLTGLPVTVAYADEVWSSVICPLLRTLRP